MNESAEAAALDTRRLGKVRRVWFFGIWALITLGGVLTFWDLLVRMGGIEARYFLLPIFTILFGQLAFGFCHALFGFIILWRGRDPLSITALPPEAPGAEPQGRTALLFPVYNEDPARYFASVETIYRELDHAGALQHFDFFVLSDSTNPNRWIEEEVHWLETVERLDAQGRLFYRKRRKNINQKSGNIADFCRRWGKNYETMICFDADSLMSAETVLRLVKLMAEHPSCGILQSMPRLFNGRSLLGRLQQFTSRIHGAIAGAGLNYWQQDYGNYWGHNAIIRVAPFIENCTLPDLPGAQPLGGRVMSHDFVEAALMRRAGYTIWLAYDLEGTYEEMPPSLLDFAARDRRWSQGNLQHLWIMLFGDVPWANRLHMLNGVLAYLSGPLWFCFLAVGTLLAYAWENSSLTLLTIDSDLPWIGLGLAGQGALVFGFTLALIFVPKLFPLILLARKPETVRLFGGFLGASASILIEIALFTLLAPSLMLFHTSFVVAMLFGKKVTWDAQSRDGGGTAWPDALRAQGGHLIVGVLWTILAFSTSSLLGWWMSPVLLGWMLAVPMSVWTSSEELGCILKKSGLLLTPEETAPPPEISALLSREKEEASALRPIPELEADFGIMRVVVDPYVNALHTIFIHPRPNKAEETRSSLVALRTRLLAEGAPRLSREEKTRLLSDVESIRYLHREVWLMPRERLSNWWRLALDRFNRESLFRVTFKDPN